MRKQEKKIKSKAVLENLEKLIDFVISCARDWKIDEQVVPDIHLAVDEACANIIKYAYPPEKSGEIEIICSREGGKFISSIRDWGRPFDPTKAPRPDLNLDLDRRAVGGLGVFLMRKYSDKIIYRRENESNLLQIVKNI